MGKKVLSIGGMLPKAWKNWRTIVGPVKLLEHRFQLRAKRKALQEKVDALKREEEEIDNHYISQLTPAQLTGFKCRYGSASLREKIVPKVVDKKAFVQWMAENDAADCAYGRANEEACNARWEAGKSIDGIEKFHDKKLTLSESK